MNTTKILCKYLDDENKGYVNGENIICAVSLVGVIAGLIISFSAMMGLVLSNGVYAPILTLTELYTNKHIVLGFSASFVSCVLLYTAYLLLKAFSKHKFVTCEHKK